jgi:hypothetical protein
LFFETASPEEIRQRLHEEVYITRVEITVELQSIIRQSGVPRAEFES